MKSASSFLLASRQCEIAELEQLARTSELVSVIGRLVHALQRERGISNGFISSRGQRFERRLREQLVECAAAESAVRTHLDSLETQGTVRNGSRLFSRVALVLHALESLPEVRDRVQRQVMGVLDATAAFGKLIAGLLAVVFEAADSAGDPDVSRALVALLHLMQGKEFAGQERAIGARSFAAGHINEADQRLWRHLIESQQACLQVYLGFDVPAPGTPPEGEVPATPADLARLRHLGCGGSAGPLDTFLSDPWYEVCTGRIDSMKQAEDRLATHLRQLCERRIAQAHTELSDQRAALDHLLSEAQPVDPDRPSPPVTALERAVLEMAQAQSRRLQAMADELEDVRARLTERKLIERAKGVLMAHQGLSEDEAYKALRQLAMNQNKRLVDIAQAVLSVADVLPVRAR